MTEARLLRIFDYCHLTSTDLRPPERPNIFFDPADTEAGVWATVDLVEPGSTVLDLGSGSGAAAAAVARAGAAHIHGLDISAESVAWASEHYALEEADKRVSFSIADYAQLSTPRLLKETAFTEPPDVVTSNPPYVPLAPSAGGMKVSIDGGNDGLRWVRIVIKHAAALESALGLTIGSYSSPRLAACLLREAGYGIASLTLSALRLGDYTLSHQQRVMELEETGEGPLLRAEDGMIYYLIVGLSCRRLSDTRSWESAAPLSPDDLLQLLVLACRAKTALLETLDNHSFEWPVPIRVLVLPDEPHRHHC